MNSFDDDYIRHLLVTETSSNKRKEIVNINRILKILYLGLFCVHCSWMAVHCTMYIFICVPHFKPKEHYFMYDCIANKYLHAHKLRVSVHIICVPHFKHYFMYDCIADKYLHAHKLRVITNKSLVCAATQSRRTRCRPRLCPEHKGRPVTRRESRQCKHPSCPGTRTAAHGPARASRKLRFL